MTSKGIGDVRRVLGSPKSWEEQTFWKPSPPLPPSGGDELLGFACARVSDWESQVVREASEYRNRELGAAMVRYALDIRRLCDALRLILARYGELRDSDPHAAAALRPVIKDLASAWNKHYDWRDDWS